MRSYIVCVAGSSTASKSVKAHPIWEIELEDGTTIEVPRNKENSVIDESLNIVHQLRDYYVKRCIHIPPLPKFENDIERRESTSKRIYIDVDFFSDLINEMKRTAFLNKMMEIAYKYTILSMNAK